MHSLRSAAVQYTNYGTGGAFELPTQSGTYIYYTDDTYSTGKTTHLPGDLAVTSSMSLKPVEKWIKS